jgi:hypothetical protein
MSRTQRATGRTDHYGKTAAELHAALNAMTRHITFSVCETSQADLYPDEGIYPDAQCPILSFCVSSSGDSRCGDFQGTIGPFVHCTAVYPQEGKRA